MKIKSFLIIVAFLSFMFFACASNPPLSEPASISDFFGTWRFVCIDCPECDAGIMDFIFTKTTWTSRIKNYQPNTFEILRWERHTINNSTNNSTSTLDPNGYRIVIQRHDGNTASFSVFMSKSKKLLVSPEFIPIVFLRLSFPNQPLTQSPTNSEPRQSCIVGNPFPLAVK